jgi:ketosteroid isomerase-like protein
MDKSAVDRWLEAYLEAWKSYDREQISALFAENVQYRYHPYDDPVSGRDSLVEAWLGEGDHPGASARDEPGTFEASYRAIAVDGDVAVATGTSSYRAKPGDALEQVFDNCFVIRFDSDGRCAEFTEWFMERPKP